MNFYDSGESSSSFTFIVGLRLFFLRLVFLLWCVFPSLWCSSSGTISSWSMVSGYFYQSVIFCSCDMLNPSFSSCFLFRWINIQYSDEYSRIIMNVHILWNRDTSIYNHSWIPSTLMVSQVQVIHHLVEHSSKSLLVPLLFHFHLLHSLNVIHTWNICAAHKRTSIHSTYMQIPITPRLPPSTECSWHTLTYRRLLTEEVISICDHRSNVNLIRCISYTMH